MTATIQLPNTQANTFTTRILQSPANPQIQVLSSHQHQSNNSLNVSSWKQVPYMQIANQNNCSGIPLSKTFCVDKIRNLPAMPKLETAKSQPVINNHDNVPSTCSMVPGDGESISISKPTGTSEKTVQQPEVNCDISLLDPNNNQIRSKPVTPRPDSDVRSTTPNDTSNEESITDGECSSFLNRIGQGRKISSCKDGPGSEVKTLFPNSQPMGQPIHVGRQTNKISACKDDWKNSSNITKVRFKP